MSPSYPNQVGDQLAERWRRMWSHREELLKVARRRSANAEDAEDAVHEAMLRAAEHPNVDDERLAAWLTTVTVRLCADRYRQVRRDGAMHGRTALAPAGPAPVDETVCDRAEAEWLADRSKELPARQVRALRLKSDGRDVEQIAQEMGLSYEAVESLLARARRTLRRSLAGTMGAAVWLWGRGKDLAGGAAPAAVAVSAASAAAAGVLVVTGWPPYHEPRPAPAPAPSAAYRTDVPGPWTRGPGDEAARTGRDTNGTRPRAGSAAVSPGTGHAAAHPGTSALPDLNLSTLTTGGLPRGPLPQAPALPALPTGAATTVPTAVPTALPTVPTALPSGPLP